MNHARPSPEATKAPPPASQRVAIVTHAPRGARTGNRVTALRWAGILRALGHRVSITAALPSDPIDLLVALHARHGHDAVVACRALTPATPILVTLTGTDLYRDLGGDDADAAARAAASLAAADRILGLHPDVARDLPMVLRDKVRVIVQSASPPPERSDPAARPDADDRHLDVVVIGHLRDVKDPLLAARAARRLPPSSRVRVTWIGDALEPGFDERVRREVRDNPRVRWIGARPRAETLRLLADAAALILTSKAEGGANVLSEAVVCGVPVLSTRIAAATALLGDDHPGLFDVGDDAALAELLRRLEDDPAFRDALAARSLRLAPRFAPAREREAWRALLVELFPSR